MKTSEEEKLRRIGEINYNHQGYKMEIIGYTLHTNIVVRFENGYEKKTTYEKFKEGKIKNDFAPSVCGVGVVGKSGLCSSDKKYQAWISMLQRCYSDKHKKDYPTYIGVTCCEEWLYLPNFVAWIESQENWNNICELKWQVDKDILVRGNKEYSPDKCCLVTNNVNSLFVKKNANRGNLPIGVSWFKPNNYRMCCKNPYGKPIQKVGYKTAEEAFLAYKETKESMIKQVADTEYKKGMITTKCYETMMNYDVRITD